MNTAVSSKNIPSPHLPDKPLFVVEARGSGVDLNLKELWAHRELLYFMVWRDVKIRYKQTLLGAAWAVLQPLLTMLIFTLIFSKVAKIDSDGIPYPVFAYAGLLPWSFFSGAITNSGDSLVSNAHLITKVYFPRLIIPIAVAGAALVSFAVAFPLLVVLMFYYQIGLTLNILLLPFLVLLTTLLAIAVGTWLSAVNVKYRDVKFATPFLVQVWMYASPIAYPASVVPQRFKFLYSLNPLTGIIEGYRAALFGLPINWSSLGIVIPITLALLAYASHEFRKMEKTFADII